MSNALRRIVTAALAVPIVLALAYAGGWIMAGVLILITALSQQELFKIMDVRGGGVIQGVAIAASSFLLLIPLFPEGWAVAVLFCMAVLAADPLRGRVRSAQSAGALIFVIIYPALFLVSLLALRHLPALPTSEAGFALLASVLVLVWTEDISAYYAGRAVGLHQMAATISPNKTWEGFAGGVLGVFVVAAGLKMWLVPFLTWTDIVIVAGICAFIAPVGDLLVSGFKRAAQLDDTGDILPGHGGLLDRIDALVFGGPLIYLYLRFLSSIA